MQPRESVDAAVSAGGGRARVRALAQQPDAGRSPASARTRLFRAEALAARETQWLGTVLLTPRPAHRAFAVFATVAAAGILALLFYADFTRTAKVRGWLIPQEGLVRVFAPHAGVVSGLHVEEGAEVRQGDRLLTISAELESAALGATQAEIARRLRDQRQSLIDERRQRDQLLVQRLGTLTGRAAVLRSELAQIDREIALLGSRVDLAERTATRHRELLAQGFISELMMQQVEAERLEQRERLSTRERERIGVLREIQAAESELAELPLEAQAESATLDRDIAIVEQELAQTEAQRELVVTAPQNGTVTAILAELGSHAGGMRPLLAIVPAGGKLEAHLYAPSRAVGFVRPGQRVVLRYQAYPYQKFGHHEGVVASVSRSPVSPGELPPELAGFNTTTGAGEPVYRITASLENQTVTAYGEEVPLQPGMQLEADVALETRRIFEWVLEPLYTLTGKW